MKRITYLLILLSLSLIVVDCSDDDNGNSIVITGEVSAVKTYGGSKNESAQAVTKTNDGGYVVLGYTQSMDGDITDKQNESFNYWVLKFSSENQLQWSKNYGGTDDDKGKDIIQTSDGGYAIIGSSKSNDEDVTQNAGLQDYWIVKLDVMGTISWQKSFGYQGGDYGISVIQTNDLGYLVSGILDVTASGGEGNTSRTTNRHSGGDYWALKLNINGEIQWSKYFGGNFTDTPEGIVQTEDNGFLIAGRSDSNDTDISSNIGSYDFWVIKISSIGGLVWEKSYGGDEIDEARAIIKSGDGNYIIAGDTRSNNNDISTNYGAADLWLIKISPLGDLLWQKSIGGSSFDVARAIVKTQDNGFLLAGSSRSNDIDVSENNGQNDAWVLKVNSQGNLLWETTIGGTNIDFAYGVAELNNTSVIAVGDTTSSDGDILENKGFTDLLLIQID